MYMYVYSSYLSAPGRSRPRLATRPRPTVLIQMPHGFRFPVRLSFSRCSTHRRFIIHRAHEHTRRGS